MLSSCRTTLPIAHRTHDGEQSCGDVVEGQSLALVDESPCFWAVIQGEIVEAAAVGAERLPSSGRFTESLPPIGVTACRR